MLFRQRYIFQSLSSLKPTEVWYQVFIKSADTLQNTNGAKASATWWLGSAPAVVSVPVLQPARQLIGTALVSLLANHSLQRARAVLVNPEQSGTVLGR